MFLYYAVFLTYEFFKKKGYTMIRQNKLLIIALLGLIIVAAMQGESLKVRLSGELFHDKVKRSGMLELPDNPRYSDIKKAIKKQFHLKDFAVALKDQKTKQLTSLQDKIGRKREGDRHAFWSSVSDKQILYVKPEIAENTMLKSHKSKRHHKTRV